MATGWKTPSELASFGTCVQGHRLHLDWYPEWLWLKPCEKALNEPGAREPNASCYSAPWDDCPGSVGWGLPCP